MLTKTLPDVCITCGDPAGIGPELILRVLPEFVEQGVTPLVIMPRGIWSATARATSVDLPFRLLETPEESCRPGTVNLWNPGIPELPFSVGEVSRNAGAVALEALAAGGAYCRDHPAVPLVTAPVSKQALHLAGFRHPGQTEYLESVDGRRRAWMIMYHPRLQVVFVTTHLPLSRVESVLDEDSVAQAARVLADFLRALGKDPRLSLLALNPHASDGGLFGDCEERLLLPVVLRLQREGYGINGPIPADTAFHKGRGSFVALYHDQGMIPFKILSGWEGVNVTWGLGFRRTSPDHGTAFDLAGTGKADPASMRAAVELALQLESNPGE